MALEYDYHMPGWWWTWIGTFTTDGSGNGVFNAFYPLSSGTHNLGIDVVDHEPGNYWYAEFVSNPLAYPIQVL